ncbi:queuosine salvage family protein [Candidatus Poriferisocius sp.]|uniref:queuosine salvage family protein n=1 Tax=Candidatus Poriferisocius sp. TaxID=3101276 RepID=UPI003B018D07
MYESPVWSSPVLRSVRGVVERSRHVRTSVEAIEQVASWMAYEEFAFPSGAVDEAVSDRTDPAEIIDVSFFYAVMNFAFTDFDSGMKFAADYGGRTWSDSEGMFACVARALDDGVPLTDGAYLAEISRAELGRVFTGNIELPMLDERVEILNAAGQVLAERYGGSAHRFVADCAPAMYAAGNGLMERLVAEFPRFNDVSTHDGHEVQLHKLAQLWLWQLHMALASEGAFAVADLDRMTAFADYIVPVALRLMDILSYAPDLEAAINRGELIAADSPEEVEIRAHTLYATALLTDAINQIRPPSAALVVPQVDFRLWKAYHATFWPHHLTRTIMY